MEFIRNIRLKIGGNLLRKKAEKNHRKIFYSNINLVKKIGIVWDASDVNEFHFLSKFCQKMHERNIDVNIIGYFNGKNLPDQYTAIRYLTCFKKEELNFFYHPFSAESESFINNRFDILIDLNFRDLLPLRYLSVLSKSAFKIGLYDPEKNNDCYDLMMEIKKPVAIGDYLDQAIHYLEMIHSQN